MKKYIFILFVLAFNNNYSQNLISARYGSNYLISKSGSAVFGGPGLTFQHQIGDLAAVGINADYMFDSYGGTAISIEPRFDLYASDVFEGFYIGTNTALNLFSYSSAMSLHLGLRLGFGFPISEPLKMEFNTGIGYNKSLDDTKITSSFSYRPSFSLGYNF